LNTCVILSGAKHALSMSKGISDTFSIFEPVLARIDPAFQGFFVASAASLPSLLRMTSQSVQHHSTHYSFMLIMGKYFLPGLLFSVECE